MRIAANYTWNTATRASISRWTMPKRLWKTFRRFGRGPFAWRLQWRVEANF